MFKANYSSFFFAHLLCPLHAFFFPPLILLLLSTFQITDHTHHHYLDCPFQHHTSFLLIEHHFHHVASGSIFFPWQGYLHHPITFIAHVLQSVINSSSLTSISPSVLHIPCVVGIVSCHYRFVQPSSSVSGFPFPPHFFLTVSYGHLP